MIATHHAADVESGLVALDANRVAALEWTQPRRLHRRWELRGDGDLLATLTSRPWHRGFFARTHSAVWSIRESLIAPLAILRDEATVPVARARRRGWRTLEIERTAGESLVWKRTSLLGTTQALENREGFPLLTFRRNRRFLAVHAEVRLEDAARALPDLEPLLMLGWALVLISSRSHAH